MLLVSQVSATITQKRSLVCFGKRTWKLYIFVTLQRNVLIAKNKRKTVTHEDHFTLRMAWTIQYTLINTILNKPTVDLEQGRTWMQTAFKRTSLQVWRDTTLHHKQFGKGQKVWKESTKQCFRTGPALASAGPDWKHSFGAPLMGVGMIFSRGVAKSGEICFLRLEIEKATFFLLIISKYRGKPRPSSPLSDAHGPTQWLVQKFFRRVSSHNHRNHELCERARSENGNAKQGMLEHTPQFHFYSGDFPCPFHEHLRITQ